MFRGLLEVCVDGYLLPATYGPYQIAHLLRLATPFALGAGAALAWRHWRTRVTLPDSGEAYGAACSLFASSRCLATAARVAVKCAFTASSVAAGISLPSSSDSTSVWPWTIAST